MMIIMNQTDAMGMIPAATPIPVQDECLNGTDIGCGPNGLLGNNDPTEEILEQEFAYGLRLWHIVGLSAAAVLGLIILLCCCIKFRIPRTKQEIEGDYIRRKILKKFRSRLKAIQNQELDEMDLKRALDKIRAEFKSDTESEAGFSVATISSSGGHSHGHHSSTYRRASQIIAMDISLEDLKAQQTMGISGRFALAFTRFFGRSGRVAQTAPKNPPKNTTPEDALKKETPASPLPAKGKVKESTTVATVDETSGKKKKTTGKKEPATHSVTQGDQNTDKKAIPEKEKKEKDKEKGKEKEKPVEKSKEKPKEKGKEKSMEKEKSSKDTKQTIQKEASKKGKDQPEQPDSEKTKKESKISPPLEDTKEAKSKSKDKEKSVGEKKSSNKDQKNVPPEKEKGNDAADKDKAKKEKEKMEKKQLEKEKKEKEKLEEAEKKAKHEAEKKAKEEAEKKAKLEGKKKAQEEKERKEKEKLEKKEKEKAKKKENKPGK